MEKMMKQGIHHLKFEDLPAVSRGNGIVNKPIAYKKIGAKSLHSGITHMPPKTKVPPHCHNTEEQVTVLQGTMKIILDGDTEVICNKFDSTFLAGGIQHELINDTNEEVIAMVTYGSGNVDRTFTATGKTVEIGSDEDIFPQ